MKIVLSERIILKLASTPYGYWLSSDGKLEEVGIKKHFEVGQNLFIKKHGKRSSNLYSDLFNEGWCRIINPVLDEAFQINWIGQLTKNQIDQIESLQRSFKPNHIEIHNGIYYDLNNPKKINLFFNRILYGEKVKINESIRDKVDQNPNFFSTSKSKIKILYSI